MSDVATAANTAPPANTAPAAQSPVQIIVGPASPPPPPPPPPTLAPTPPEPATPAEPILNQKQFDHVLKPRLEHARQVAEYELLKTLGVPDKDTAQKLIEAGKGLSTATTQATTWKTVAERQQVALKNLADHSLAALTPERQTAVKQLAGDDPGKQLEVITALQKTWGPPEPIPGAGGQASTTGPVHGDLPPVPPANTTAPAAAPAAAPLPPANTAPAAPAPAGGTVAPVDHKAEFNRMWATNPFAAARYGEQHPEVYIVKP